MPPSSATTPPAPAARWPLALAAALLVGGSALSLWAWQFSATYLGQQADAELERFSELTFSNIGQRAQHQIDLLAGFQALFVASDSVSREEFHRRFSDMRVQARFPGLLAVQFAQLVGQGERAAFEASVRADRSLVPEGYPLFAIHPPGERSHYLAITYNEPMQGNEAAFGHDNQSDAARREVVERARDSAAPQASAPVMLLQQRQGVLVRLPVYRRGAPTATVAQRRAAYAGQVSGVWLLADVLRDTLPTIGRAPYQVRVNDVGLADPVGPAAAASRQATLVARSHPDGPGALWGAGALAPRAEDRREHTLAMAGRLWTIEVARPAVDHRQAAFPLLLLGGGLSISLLLSLAAGRLTLMQRRAQHLALAMSAQARANAERLDAVFNSTADGLITLDHQGTMLSVNQAAQRIFGHPAQRMVGRSLNLLMPLGAAAQLGQWLGPLGGQPDGAAAPRGRRQQARRADGTLFPIELAISEIDVDGERQYVGLLRDMSHACATQDRIDAAANALAAANGLREAVFEHAPVALIVCDAHGLLQAMNPAAERLLRCRASDEVARNSLGSFHDEGHHGALGQMLQALAGPAHGAPAGTTGMGGTGSATGTTSASLNAGSIERTLHLVRRDGDRVPVSLTVSALHDRAGRISGFLSIAYDITERQRLADQLSQLAYHDALTGLPNRIRLEDHLAQAIAKAGRSHDALALLFIDLDRFKPINDNHGHAVGDQVLCEVARRLQATLRTSDMVARLGGDEFVVLLATLSSPDDCLVVADKLLSALAEPMVIGALTLQVGASIGVARHPDAGTNAAELLRYADAAMYRVKQAGRLTMQQASQADRAQRS